MCYGKGWFLKVDLSNFEADKENPINGEGYFEVMKKKVEKEHEELKSIYAAKKA
jgi:hypothetical protein